MSRSGWECRQLNWNIEHSGAAKTRGRTDRQTRNAPIFFINPLKHKAAGIASLKSVKDEGRVSSRPSRVYNYPAGLRVNVEPIELSARERRNCHDGLVGDHLEWGRDIGPHRRVESGRGS